MYISKEDKSNYLSMPALGQFDVGLYHIEVKDIVDVCGEEYVICVADGYSVFGSRIYSDCGDEYIKVSANKIRIEDIQEVSA